MSLEDTRNIHLSEDRSEKSPLQNRSSILSVGMLDADDILGMKKGRDASRMKRNNCQRRSTVVLIGLTGGMVAGFFALGRSGSVHQK